MKSPNASSIDISIVKSILKSAFNIDATRSNAIKPNFIPQSSQILLGYSSSTGITVLAGFYNRQKGKMKQAKNTAQKKSRSKVKHNPVFKGGDVLHSFLSEQNLSFDFFVVGQHSKKGLTWKLHTAPKQKTLQMNAPANNENSLAA